ncbi:hypothetical protein THS5294_00660 [Thalassobacter stenotrophicus]|uniref:Uncharacterized protein n=3 Tax=Thalassobacter stenotrophicus TaxID=266809 RepID=A0A0P1EWD3_9RHOB|nr:hypothetical protein THS5294_00660 [Thalassobacter stenotrophicus]SHI85236.1 hypothetical protein SAMN02744035_01851 [Thalassobacter stenotrophicus DSM 16310]
MASSGMVRTIFRIRRRALSQQPDLEKFGDLHCEVVEVRGFGLECLIQSKPLAAFSFFVRMTGDDDDRDVGPFPSAQPLRKGSAVAPVPVYVYQNDIGYGFLWGLVRQISRCCEEHVEASVAYRLLRHLAVFGVIVNQDNRFARPAELASIIKRGIANLILLATLLGFHASILFIGRSDNVFRTPHPA